MAMNKKQNISAAGEQQVTPEDLEKNYLEHDGSSEVEVETHGMGEKLNRLRAAVLGGKTGYTDDAKHTFVGALERDGRRLMAIVLDTTIDKGRAWEQSQDLIHEAYKFASDDAVASLDDATAQPSNTGAPVTDAPGEDGTDSSGNAEDGDTLPWEGIAVFSGVLALAGLATWLSLASAKKRRQRR